MPDPTLEAAYRATDYRVDDGPYGSFVFRIGETSADVDRVLGLHEKAQWAYITACNPGSDRRLPQENAQRMAELEAVCLYHGWTHYLGAGVGCDRTWPPELSFLVIGPSEVEAIEVARHFGQNAIVAGRRGELARLVWVA